MNLSFTTIHHDQIRVSRKAAFLAGKPFVRQLLLLVQSMLKASGQHLPHAGIIVGSMHGLNTELAVIAPSRRSILENNHGSDRLKTADIGNIIGFHTVNIGETDPRTDLLHCSRRTLLRTADLLCILLQNHHRVLMRQLDKPFLLSLFGNNDTNLITAPLAEPACNHFLILYLIF